MGLARLFGVCAAILFTSSVGAAEIIDLGPTDYRRWGTGTNTHTLEGLRSSTGQTVRMPPLNTTLNVNRNAVIPYGSLANGMRNFVRINPASVAASAAVTGLFLAVDWVFDQASGEWVVLDEDTHEYVDPVSGGWITTAASGFFPSPEAACSAITPWVTVPAYTGSGPWYPCIEPGVGERGRWAAQNPVCPVGSALVPAGCEVVIEGGYIPLSESDWSELEAFLPTASPDSVATAGQDTQRMTGAPLPGYQDTEITGPSSVSGPETTSTSTDPVTGDTVVTTTTTTTNISYGNTTITTNNTTVTNTYTNGQHTGSETTTETPGELPITGGGGGVADWPDFCDWATVVCDWLDWTREDPPPEQDLPAVIDDDFFEEKRISFGSKSCPPDHEINLAPFLDTTVGVSFQPLCDFAGLIYYMVMAASYIIAAYISIGVARNA